MHTLQYLLRESRAGKKADGADGSPLAFFHPNLFTYAPNRGPASTVPPSYIALGRACVAEDPLQRPTFDEVLYALNGVRRDAEQQVKEEPTAAAEASGMFAIPELEPDPDESSAMNSRESILAAQATRLRAGRSNASGTGFCGTLGVALPGGNMLGGVPSSALGGGPGSGLGGALGGISLGSDVLGRIPSSALGGCPGSSLGGTLGGIPLLGSDVLASQAGSRPLLGGSCDS